MGLLATSGVQAQARRGAQTAQPCVDYAYTGYGPTGPKGEWEVDLTWQRRVRAEASPAGCLRYVLRAAPREGAFDSLEPVPLGGSVTGFVGTRDDRQWLFDPFGRRLLDEAFNGGVEIAYTGGPLTDDHLPAALTLKAGKGRYTYLRVQNGRMVARAPHGYTLQSSSTPLGGQHRPVNFGAFKRVATQEGRVEAVGLIDLRSLREVVPPRYADVGVLAEGEERKPWLLFGQRGAAGGERIDFFKPTGEPVALPAARHLDLVTEFGSPLRVRYMMLRDAERAGCIYIDRQFKPMLPETVPVPPGHPCPVLSEDEPLRLTSASGHVHRYRYQAASGLTPLGPPVPGALVAGHRGRFVVRELLASEQALPVAPVDAPIDTPAAGAAAAAAAAATGGAALPAPPVDAAERALAEAAAAAESAARRDAARETPMLPTEPPAGTPVRYRIYHDDGTPVPADAGAAPGFDGFENLGCGVWRVQREGQWYQIDAQGQLGTHFTYPFSC
ncbi:MAG: hypothetical protein Q4G71_05825 [Pseudomonadota bacterium]|nr:hypothetical protein [Pseudomonadota bacterium]